MMYTSDVICWAFVSETSVREEDFLFNKDY